jgi:glycoprotein 3-alpha-L-fucosyltransferase
MRKNYFFYLAFENSLCTDYITEKFWLSLQLDVVPVVLGPSVETYTRVAPPNSFLHVKQFASPEELGRRLQRLMQRPEEYNALLAWKRKYSIGNTGMQCDLCEFAFTANLTGRRTFDFKAWWNESRLCDASL